MTLPGRIFVVTSLVVGALISSAMVISQAAVKREGDPGYALVVMVERPIQYAGPVIPPGPKEMAKTSVTSPILASSYAIR